MTRNLLTRCKDSVYRKYYTALVFRLKHTASLIAFVIVRNGSMQATAEYAHSKSQQGCRFSKTAESKSNLRERDIRHHLFHQNQFSSPSSPFSSATSILTYHINTSRNQSNAKTQLTMHPQTLLAAITVLAMGVVPTLALPEPKAIPELLVDRAQCVGGHHLVGSGCAPGRKGHTSCSADDRSVVSIPRCFDRFD